MVSIDFIVELPITTGHNRHILVVNDHFTEYFQLYAVKDRTAPTAAKCGVDLGLKFGPPSKLFSDQDPALEIELFQFILKELGVNKLWTTTYHAQSNELSTRKGL